MSGPGTDGDPVSARLRQRLVAATRSGDEVEAARLKTELDALTAKQTAVRPFTEHR